MRTRGLALLGVAILVGAVGLMLGGCGTSTPTQLTSEQRQSIQSALQAAGLPAAQSVEITGGRLVATFEVELSTSPRAFAEKAIMTIRNAAQPFDTVNSYRVTVNGPSPGPGLIQRIGSARFTEGSAAGIEWEAGLRR